ncbi:MAG: YkgJ family cysteine cluster protein, partial [Phycisphaerae bacterium]|nr:YkgJ family cysteine cluster protein [Phycisphaerae bacterium]
MQLIDDEAQRVRNLKWPEDDPTRGRAAVFEHGGKAWLAKDAQGDCVFLNHTTKLCRIHETFGEATKPLGCRLYPFQIVPTFDNEATVSARFDCPRVRENVGKPHADALPELQ